jgi:N-acetylmuramoyl-L-alanine amidase
MWNGRDAGEEMGSRVIGRRQLLRGILGAGAGCIVLGGARRAVAETWAAKSGAKTHLVVLDPGHGGIDPGAIGFSGAYEKDIALATARELARLLEASKRYRVQLTRDSDEFVALQDRVTHAHSAGAELFLSIHADALPNAGTRGASVFTLSERASDREAAELAARENKADLIAGIDLSRHEPVVSEILLDLARRQTNNLSIRLARDMVLELGREVKLLNNTHRSAGFAVLKAPDVPSALVELGCLSNKEEDRLLQQPGYQRRLAAGLARSINDYFDFIGRA